MRRRRIGLCWCEICDGVAWRGEESKMSRVVYFVFEMCLCHDFIEGLEESLGLVIQEANGQIMFVKRFMLYK